MTTAKISKNLTAVRSDNTNLQWENGIAGTRVQGGTGRRLLLRSASGKGDYFFSRITRMRHCRQSNSRR